MSLFDKIASAVGDSISGNTERGGIFQQAIDLVNSPEIGGFSGLINKFENGGLKDIISSWIGSGSNQPISSDQIINALGTDKIREISGKLGISDSQVSDGLATVLPTIIDKLTPNGQIPEGDVLKQGLSLLSKQISKG